MDRHDQNDLEPPPTGWWESWSVAAVAILVLVVAIVLVVGALLVYDLTNNSR